MLFLLYLFNCTHFLKRQEREKRNAKTISTILYINCYMKGTKQKQNGVDYNIASCNILTKKRRKPGKSGLATLLQC